VKVAPALKSAYSKGVNVPNPHSRIDEENRERDRRLAALIRMRPEVIELAKRNLKNWIGRWAIPEPAWEEWSQLLGMLTPEQVAAFLESTTPKANRLRQSSPFIGVVEGAETCDAADPHAA
jgi:hypothetical protein